MIRKQDLIDCIKMAYEQAMLDEANEDKYGTADYIEDFNPFTPAPIDGDEAQYAVEFGWMMAREGMKPKEKEFDAYLQGILFESGSKLTLKDLV
jgi:hypothetical protein